MDLETARSTGPSVVGFDRASPKATNKVRAEIPYNVHKLAKPNVPAPVLVPTPLAPEPYSPSSEISHESPRTPKLEKDSFGGSSVKLERRMIYYKVAEEDGSCDMSEEGLSFIFKGSRIEELVERLEDETGVADLVICSQWNGKLYVRMLGHG